jgi:hypothetical protein
MAYPYSRRRIPRNPPQPDLTDANGNGYPDAFEAEETQLMAQIAQRRKQFMQGAGQAEDMFTTSRNNEVGDGDDQSVIDNLLR